jgi:flagellar protein FliS
MDPRVAYRQADARGATSLRLVVLLYEQIIQDLRQASMAIDHNQIELRTKRINHALDVICLLQATLNLERGGQVARNLLRFYDVVRANLCEAQFKPQKKSWRDKSQICSRYAKHGNKSNASKARRQFRR